MQCWLSKGNSGISQRRAFANTVYKYWMIGRFVGLRKVI